MSEHDEALRRQRASTLQDMFRERDRLYKERRELQDQVEALEAKLREVEEKQAEFVRTVVGALGVEPHKYDKWPDPGAQALALAASTAKLEQTHFERAEKAERERDEARAALRVAALRVHRMSPYHDDDPDTCEHEECSLVRAALGEKP